MRFHDPELCIRNIVYHPEDKAVRNEESGCGNANVGGRGSARPGGHNERFVHSSLGFHWREVRMWKKVVGVAWEAGGARLHPPRPAFHLRSFLLYDPA